MTNEHYFSSTPESDLKLRTIHATIAGVERELFTSNGIFSPAHIDTGTQVLLSNVPAPPPGGNLLDLGCGWGPMALTLALESPHATVWAVDVNERALDLVRANAKKLSIPNINAVLPQDVPEDITFMSIWSNPPIRVGKAELHNIMKTWLPRLENDADAWLVVQKNLGSDSLHSWMQSEFPDNFVFTRASTNKGYRLLRAHKRAQEAR
ncbi:class I SAM-dependent methyltransferase [Salinibacterium sp. M195]|uniref:class I SAM-dependent methyltransferase n=1 Tax=Salinibacterium sp. M195 TaxID=2583374 RepID=UPI001C631350|nr:methyltransferase [Salinibacterium sp. M195]QYH36443.1 methyltransferase [Salinibacterium sp. M195]